MENFFADFTSYDHYAQHIIPRYEEIQSKIVNGIKEWVDWPKTVILDIGCGTGYTIEKIINEYPNISAIGIDGSRVMLEKANQRLLKYPNTRWSIHLHDITDLPATPPLQAAISIATLNNVEHKNIETIYRGIFTRLVEGGVFIHADFIAHESELANNLIEEAYSEYVKSHIPSEDFFSKWSEHSEAGYYPLTLTQHIQKLERAGFGKVKLLWLFGNFAIFSAVKK